MHDIEPRPIHNHQPPHQPHPYQPPQAMQPPPLPPQKERAAGGSGKQFMMTLLAVIVGTPLAWVATFMLLGIFAVIVAISAGGSESGSTIGEVSTKYIAGNETAEKRIVVIPLNGPILSGSSSAPLSILFDAFTDGDVVKRQLIELSRDESVMGVILQIDSPGGLITASKSITDGIEYFRQKTNKPVESFINGMGASGAYWAASATDKITAIQGSEAGSIGVIFGPLARYNGIVSDGQVTTKDSIDYTYFTAGRSKDIGNPFRDMTQPEKDFLNQQIQEEYDVFVNYVADRRKISSDTIRNDIGALPYSAKSAQAKKLIDQVGNVESVYASVAQGASTDSYKIEEVVGDGGFLSSLFGAQGLISKLRYSATNIEQGRAKYCSEKILNRPLMYSADISSLCK